MSNDLDKVLDSGSLEDIDAILTALEQGVDEEQALAAVVESGDTGSDPAATPEQNELDTAPPAPESSEPPVILAKDGKHTIPYSALEAERNQAAALRNQLNELQRKNQLLEQQLTEADIKPKQLPEEIRFTPEQLAELSSYGEIGEAVAVLAQQNAALLEQLGGRAVQPAAQAPVAEPTNPFAENPDTLRWAQSDVHWGVVENVNAVMDADPKWANMSHAQRIPEIVRRTKLALGEATDHSIDQAADVALQRAVRVAPNSLTDVGGEILGSSKTTAEQLAIADMDEVQSVLEKQLARGMSMDEALASLL